MAMSMILDLDGVGGESKVDGYTDKIDILSYSLGFHQSATGHRGGGSAGGVSGATDLSVVKYLDKSSSQLSVRCLTGSHFPKVTFYVLKSVGDDSKEPYYVITMENVIVSSYSLGGTPSEDQPTETISLNFEKIKTEYFYQDADGTLSDGGSMEYSMKEAKKLA